MAESTNTLESCGFMVHDVARLMRRNFNRRVQDLQMTQAQWRTIAILSRKPGISQKALADILEIQPISAARLLDRLQAAEWIERRPDPDDRRAVQLHLTDKADPITKKIRAKAAETYKQAMTGISEEDQQKFFDVLTRMRANVIDCDETKGK
jgi:DNA-binding MarR family transcriptional regulator